MLRGGTDRLFAQGEVLAVPERAVIDTGARKVVYREAGPSLYDGVEVELGPRCGDYYPVLQAACKRAIKWRRRLVPHRRRDAAERRTRLDLLGASGGRGQKGRRRRGPAFRRHRRKTLRSRRL